MQIEAAVKFRPGNMARAGGRLLKICGIESDVAECVWFDNRGRLHVRDYEIEALSPLEISSRPRSLWPEINEMPDHIVEQLDAVAAERRRKRFSKPRRSNKLRRA